MVCLKPGRQQRRLLTLCTELVVPALQSGPSSGRTGEQMLQSWGDNCCGSGVGCKQPVQELRLKYWGAHTGNHAYITIRNLNNVGDFSWQILARSCVLNGNQSKELFSSCIKVYINEYLDNVVRALENPSTLQNGPQGKHNKNFSQLYPWKFRTEQPMQI